MTSLAYIFTMGGRTGLMARASDSGSGDPGSILGRVGVFVSLSKRHLLPQKVLVIPRNRWLRLNMTEKLFTGTLNHNQNKTKNKKHFYNGKSPSQNLFWLYFLFLYLKRLFLAVKYFYNISRIWS